MRIVFDQVVGEIAPGAGAAAPTADTEPPPAVTDQDDPQR